MEVKYFRWLEWAFACGLLVLAVRELTQNWQGNEIASHPDEAAHYVTGVMGYEYVRGHLGENPIGFAEQFYARYPKVAIGHWPPGYYAIQAVWFGFVGPGIWQAHGLNWLLAFSFVGVWWWRLRGVLSGALALGSGAWLLSLPVLHRCTELVLSDWGAILWTWAAGAVWARGGSGWALVLAASLAISSKGNAWMILPALLIAPVLCGEWRKLPWREALATCLCSAPFYLWAKGSGFSYPLRNLTEANLARAIPKRWELMSDIWAAAPWLVWSLALAGVVCGAIWSRGQARRWWAFSVSILGSTLMFLLVSGLSFEDRAMAIALPFMGVLLLLPAMIWPGTMEFGLLALFFALRDPVPIDSVKGFRGMAETLAAKPPALLVASDSVGEGAMVAQTLDRDAKRESVVLRGSRMFSQQDWNGKRLSMRYENASQVRELLDAVPVSYILLDSVNAMPYAEQLRELSKQWTLVERRRSKARVLELFAIPTNLGKPLQEFSLELGLERGGRKITYRPGPL